MEHREENPEAVLEPDLPICDPHHHLWDIPGRRYLLDEFLRDTSGGHRIESTVYVECGSYYRANGPEHLRPVGEVEFADRQAALAASGRYGATRVAAGIVAHADMMLGARVEEVLAAHVAAAPERLKGVRHVTAWEVSDRILGHGVVVPEMLAQPAFREAFAKLAMFGLSYDALGFHPQIGEAADLAAAFPEQPIVFDHVGGVLGIGPYAGRRDEVFATWKPAIQELARRPNVYIKLGGLGMTFCGFGFHKLNDPAPSEALAEAWRPYIETCIEAFGANRSMFESNYPMDGRSCTYRTLWNAFKRLAAGASPDEKAQLFKGVAERVYRISASIPDGAA